MRIWRMLSEKKTSLLTCFRQRKKAHKILIIGCILQILVLCVILVRSFGNQVPPVEDKPAQLDKIIDNKLSNHKVNIGKKLSLNYSEGPLELIPILNNTELPPIVNDDIDKLLISELYLKDLVMGDFYIAVNSTLRCYRDGIAEIVGMTCYCKPTFFGTDCGIPSSVWLNDGGRHSGGKGIVQRKKSRRIINAFMFNHEFDMLEARFSELKEAVDVFILLEGSVSQFGKPKQLRFLESVHQGRFAKVRNKLIYLNNISSFPKKIMSSGWEMEDYARMKLGVEGLPRIKGIRDDDIIIVSDADEIPSKDTVTFLKLYEGYSEPIFFALKWNVYGFFWKPSSSQTSNELSKYMGPATTIGAACTIKIFIKVYKRNASLLRSRRIFKDSNLLRSYRKYLGNRTYWTIGSAPYYAGWHCSWCFRPEGILIKLVSAQKDDKPRWGDYPEKRNLTYLANLRRKGIWFTGSKMVASIPYYKNANLMPSAPNYFLENYQRFKYLFVIDINDTNEATKPLD